MFSIAAVTFLYVDINAYIKWGMIIAIVLLGIFCLIKSYVLLNTLNPNSECFFGLLTQPNPPAPLQNEIEKYAFLTYGFCESSEILLDDKKELAELAKDPYFRPQRAVENGMQLAVNDFVGIYNKSKQYIPDELSTWDIHNREEALEAISFLLESAREYAEMPIAALVDYDANLQSVAELSFKTTHLDSYEINLSGVYIVRTIWVARNSFVSGYITEDELRELCLDVATFVAIYYKNWESLAYSYLVTYMELLKNTETRLDYKFLVKHAYAVQEYISSEYSPLKGTSLDELRTYFGISLSEMVE